MVIMKQITTMKALGNEMAYVGKPTNDEEMIFYIFVFVGTKYNSPVSTIVSPRWLQLMLPTMVGMVVLITF